MHEFGFGLSQWNLLLLLPFLYLPAMPETCSKIRSPRGRADQSLGACLDCYSQHAKNQSRATMPRAYVIARPATSLFTVTRFSALFNSLSFKKKNSRIQRCQMFVEIILVVISVATKFNIWLIKNLKCNNNISWPILFIMGLQLKIFFT